MSKSSGFHKKNDKQIIKKLQTSFFTINFWKKIFERFISMTSMTI